MGHLGRTTDMAELTGEEVGTILQLFLQPQRDTSNQYKFENGDYDGNIGERQEYFSHSLRMYGVSNCM